MIMAAIGSNWRGRPLPGHGGQTRGHDGIQHGLVRRQADQVMINEAPVVPLWYDVVVRLVQPRIVGFRANALNLLELRKVRIEN